MDFVYGDRKPVIRLFIQAVIVVSLGVLSLIFGFRETGILGMIGGWLIWSLFILAGFLLSRSPIAKALKLVFGLKPPVGWSLDIILSIATLWLWASWRGEAVYSMLAAGAVLAFLTMRNFISAE